MRYLYGGLLCTIYPYLKFIILIAKIGLVIQSVVQHKCIRSDCADKGITYAAEGVFLFFLRMKKKAPSAMTSTTGAIMAALGVGRPSPTEKGNRDT